VKNIKERKRKKKGKHDQAFWVRPAQREKKQIDDIDMMTR
jgi:hypothetical protein